MDCLCARISWRNQTSITTRFIQPKPTRWTDVSRRKKQRPKPRQKQTLKPKRKPPPKPKPRLLLRRPPPLLPLLPHPRNEFKNRKTRRETPRRQRRAHCF